MEKGYLIVELYTGDHVLPVTDLKVIVRDKKGNTLYNLTTDENGHTEKVSLDVNVQNANTITSDFSTYDVEVRSAKGYKKVIVYDVQIFTEITSIMPIQLEPAIEGDTPEENTEYIYIPYEHGVDLSHEQTDQIEQTDLIRNYDDNTISQQAILANEVAIPNYITVHLGSPNANAENVKVSFKDYIKNVASSEIFPTWEESALYANIYCQISFALNRTYTVWYRSRAKDFDITNNTAFDQFFVKGRNIFENISRIVDNIFNNFIRREGRKEPFFASYCNGTTSKCNGLSQYGSQELALKGYDTMQILKYYYPNDIQIVESNNFTYQMETYPGKPLKEGDIGADVLKMQSYLNRLSGNWYITPIPVQNVNGIFRTDTKTAVMMCQKSQNLIADGVIGKSTWYIITLLYVAAKELAELTSEGERIGIGSTPPKVTIQMGSRGQYVVELQFLLNYIASFFPTIPYVIRNGVFTEDTKRSVIDFQKEFRLTPDGVVGPGTWEKLYDVFNSIGDTVVIPPTRTFPGTPLKVGSKGSDVLLMQNYLNEISNTYTKIPKVVADGSFGEKTKSSVIAFQKQFGLTADGVIGEKTWYKIIEVYDNLDGTGNSQFPGTPLRVGSRGDDVLKMQTYLNAISKTFPTIPSLTADGVFGVGTQTSVKAFQSLFGLTPDGVIGKNTWDKIVNVYNNKPTVSSPVFPGRSLQVGSRGNDVIIMQKYLNAIAKQYPSIPVTSADGIFGPGTKNSVTAFQRQFGLTPDGIIGRNTWNKIVSIYNLILFNNGNVRSVNYSNTRNVDYSGVAMLLALNMMRK